MTAYVKVGGVYKSVAEANAFLKLGTYTNNTLVGAYVKVNNEYRKFYTGTDKKTFTLYPNAFASYPTRFARGTTWGNSGNAPFSGDGATTLAIGRYHGLADFVFTNENSSYLSTELAERPYVHSASLRLTRHSQTGTGYSTASGTIYVGEYSGNTTTTYPACSGVSWTDYAVKSFSGLGYGDTVTIDLNSNGHMQDLIDYVGAGGDLAITNRNSGLCSSAQSQDTDYVWFFGGPGNATSVKPMLTVELDYIPPE
jgi:hypothetical protein